MLCELISQQVTMMPHNNMDCSITMTWIIPPVNNDRTFELVFKLDHHKLLFKNVRRNYSASGNILDLSQANCFPA